MRRSTVFWVFVVVILVALMGPCPVEAPGISASRHDFVERFTGTPTTIPAEFLAHPQTGFEQGDQYVYLEANEVFPEWRTGIAGINGVVYCDDSDRPSYLVPWGVAGRDCPALTSEAGARVQVVETDFQHHQLGSYQRTLEVLAGGVWTQTSVLLQPGDVQVTIWYWRGLVRLDPTDTLILDYIP